MSDSKSKFIKKYSRKSKSPWDDSSTVLLYADSEITADGSIELSYQNYIYLHKDNMGKHVGLSCSKNLLNSNPEFEGRYMQGVEMLCFLLLYIEDICGFCQLFSDEFESLFLLDPLSYFEAAEIRWSNLIDQV